MIMYIPQQVMKTVYPHFTEQQSEIVAELVVNGRITTQTELCKPYIYTGAKKEMFPDSIRLLEKNKLMTVATLPRSKHVET